MSYIGQPATGGIITWDGSKFVTVVPNGDLSGSYATGVHVINLTIANQVQGSIIYYNGTNWVELSPGTSGNFLQTQGAGANPRWAVASGGSFTAGGDLSGSSSSQTVIGLQGHSVSSSAPTSNQVLLWNGSAWTPTSLTVQGGGSPSKSMFVNVFSNITSTNSGTFVNAGTFEFDPTVIQGAGSGTRVIKLRVIAETTTPQVTVQLYNFTTASVVTGSTLTTTSTTPATLVTGDLTSNLTNGLAVYQVQIKMAAGGGGDIATLDYAVLKVDWA